MLVSSEFQPNLQFPRLYDAPESNMGKWFMLKLFDINFTGLDFATRLFSFPSFLSSLRHGVRLLNWKRMAAGQHLGNSWCWTNDEDDSTHHVWYYLLVNMSASCFLESTNMIWIMGSSTYILSNDQSSATLWVRGTCLIVGFFFFSKKKKRQRYKVSAMIRDAKKSRGTSHSDITQTKKRKCNERRSLKGRLKRNLAGHTIDPRTHWIKRPPGPPATVSLGWLLASLSGANPDRYWASPPRPRWTAPGEVCLIVKLLPLMIMLITASLSSKMYNWASNWEGLALVTTWSTLDNSSTSRSLFLFDLVLALVLWISLRARLLGTWLDHRSFRQWSLTAWWVFLEEAILLSPHPKDREQGFHPFANPHPQK